MVEFCNDNIYVDFGGHVYQQTVGIRMDTNCAPLVADLFLYSYEADFVQHLQKSKVKKQTKNPLIYFHYIDDVVYWITLRSMIISMLFIRRKWNDGVLCLFCAHWLG